MPKLYALDGVSLDMLHFVHLLRTSFRITFCMAFAAYSLPAETYGAETAKAADAKASDVFTATKVWDIHLGFTAEQWKAMEPTQGPRAPRRQGGGFLQGPDGGRNGIAAAFGIQFNYVRADLDFGPWRMSEVGVRYKGNGTFLTSRESLKRSLKLDLNQFQKGQKLAGFSQVNLHNSVRDPSCTNESIAYRLFRDCQVPAPRTAYAKVNVTVPGLYERKYLGLYNMVEDVGGHFAEEQLGTTKGALFKPVTPNLFGYLGEDWQAYKQTYDAKATLDDAHKKRLIETCKLFANASDGEFAAKVGEYLDLENTARYLALTVWLVDLDGILGPGQNFYLHLHPQTLKFGFIPWDQDQTFGQFPRGTAEQRVNLSIRKPWTGNNRFLERLFKTEAFMTTYLARLKEFNATTLKPERIGKLVDELGPVLREPMAQESPERLAGLNKALAGETLSVVMGPGYREPIQAKPIKAFVGARWNAVEEQLAGRSQGQALGR
ncbi:MAG: hypothetical protein CAK89_00505 [Opitutia bacterium AMD-G3]|nr:MAG: hypothetical protein CAK89_00505 [Opitutae bacterium AMD-G3]